jgi:hypothetical protein
MGTVLNCFAAITAACRREENRGFTGRQSNAQTRKEQTNHRVKRRKSNALNRKEQTNHRVEDKAKSIKRSLTYVAANEVIK